MAVGNYLDMTRDQFKQARLKLGLNQTQLGKMMGRGQTFISDIERGYHCPTKVQAAFVRKLIEWKNGEEFPGE